MSSMSNMSTTMSAASSRPVYSASKLSQWCDRLIEAGWLAAIIVTPLFFNIYSSRVFEPDKLTTLRSIALVMATAWIIKFFEERNNPNRDMSISWRTPLVLPTLIMVIIYMVSTALSVAPRTSLLGSYQRLQGTYTTFSYIMVFFMVLQGLRTRAQLDRLVSLLIINSLPIAFYGMLQRYQLDPLPWGGDTTERVAGNMGNAIFIAAYLIMTFFLTLIRVADSFISVMTSEVARVSDIVRASAYILIALLNAFVVLILSGSRGPQIGWMAGLMFVVLLLAQLIRKRTLRAGITVGMIGLGLVSFLFLIGLNSSDAQIFKDLRKLPFFGRFSTSFNTVEGTNLVRVLIWRGAVELVAPHEALDFPPTEANLEGSKDTVNSIRPLIGYGPESMYVAYNRFYQPELTKVEARNASPDRSHNETWDSLVITGIIGFAAYLFLFGSVFYFGFQWLGLMTARFERVLFLGLWVIGVAAGATWALTGRKELLGIGVASGVVAAITIYVVIGSLISAFRKEEDVAEVKLSLRDRLLVIGIICTVMAHFIEIHTGIAIAASRIHFWVLIGMMAVVGTGMMQGSFRVPVAEATDASAEAAIPTATPDAAPSTPAPVRESNTAAARRRRRAQGGAGTGTSVPAPRANVRSGSFGLPDWFNSVTVYGAFIGLILGVMAFDFTQNSDRNTVAGQVFLNALTNVRGSNKLGVLLMFLITLVVGITIAIAELRHTDRLRGKDQILPAIGVMASIAVFFWVAYGTFVAGRLVAFVTAQTNSVDGILNIAGQLADFPGYLYVLIFIVMLISATLTRGEEGVVPNKTIASNITLAPAFILPVLAIWTISTSNLQPIAADIIYKQANPWDQQASRVLAQGGNGADVMGWDLAIEHYRKAIQLAPNEDFYYLWLGRALLEKAKATQVKIPTRTIQDNDSFVKVIDNAKTNWNRPDGSNSLPSAALNQEDLLAAAKIILQEARIINPLNTDHSANLARMWRQSGDIANDPGVRQQRYQNADREYAVATNLSPQNAVLWNEWGTLRAYGLNDLVGAQQKLDQSLKVDSNFDQTFLFRGDLKFQQANKLQTQRQQQQQIIASTPATDTAKIDVAKSELAKLDSPWKAALDAAKIEFTQAISINKNNLQAYGLIAEIERMSGDTPGMIKTIETMTTIRPDDWNSWKNLAILYRDNKQTEKAKVAAQKAVGLAPQDQKAGLQVLLEQLQASP